MKTSWVVMFVVIAKCSCFAVDGSGLLQVRSAMDALFASGFERRAEVLMDRGFPSCDRQAHTNLALAVSNSYDSVFANFDLCATNQLERYVLMSCGWCFGPRYFWMFLDSMIDQRMAGNVSDYDVLWFVGQKNFNSGVPYLLQDTEDYAVSNILNRLMVVSSISNYCERIKSGQALREYNEYMQELRTFK